MNKKKFERVKIDIQYFMEDFILASGKGFEGVSDDLWKITVF